MIVAAVLIALAVVLVVFGVIFGIFLGTIVFQRIVQNHIHLMNMRAEAKVYVVKDLANEMGAAEEGSAAGVGIVLAPFPPVMEARS